MNQTESLSTGSTLLDGAIFSESPLPPGGPGDAVSSLSRAGRGAGARTMPKRNQNHFTVVTTETAPM